MNFDVRTVFVSIALSLLVTSVTMLLVSRTYPQNVRRGAIRWSLACFVQGICWTSFAFRGDIPYFISYFVGNVAWALSLCLHLTALLEFKSEPYRRWLVYSPVLVMTVLYYVFSEVTPNYSGRVIVGSLGGTIMFGLCGLVLLKGERSDIPLTYRVTSFAFFAGACILLIRTVVTILYPPQELDGNAVHASQVDQVAFLLLLTFVYLISSGFLLMCNERFTVELERLASRDALTDSFNRRTIEELAARELSRCRRDGTPLSLALLDLDNFKRINDTFGHAAGDRALRHIVATLREHLRAGDFLGRFGGEEFLVVMPGTSEAAAAVVAERLRSEVEMQPVQFRGDALQITATIGIATQTGRDGDLDALLRAADDALYQGKAKGRNCVMSRG